MGAYLEGFKKYAEFKGRSTRKAFWTFYLVNTAILFFLSWQAGGGLVRGHWGFGFNAVGFPAIVFGLFVLVPTMAVIVRRLHDTGRTGWWILLGFFPLIGGLILLIFLLFDSEPNTNQYGPNPKNAISLS